MENLRGKWKIEVGALKFMPDCRRLKTTEKFNSDLQLLRSHRKFCNRELYHRVVFEEDRSVSAV